MADVTLVRFCALPAGAFGVLLLGDGPPFAVTLERTYATPGATLKIPAGEYECTKRMYFKGGYMTFEIHVEGHTAILFHKANVEAELDGCVAVGENFNEFGDHFGDRPGIANSGAGFSEFIRLLGHLSSFKLKVVDVTDLVES